MRLFKQPSTLACALCFLIAAFTVNTAHAQTRVQDFVWNNQMLSVTNHWVKPTNPGQQVGAAYMTFKSLVSCHLIKITSDAADAVEIHSMTMDKGIMKMRQLKSLTLAENKSVELSPGGFHLMLFDLKKPLTVGQAVEFSFTLKCHDQVLSPLTLTTTVKDPESNTSTHQHH